MKIKVLTRVVHTIVLLLLFSVNLFGQNRKHLAEDLWQSIDFISIKKKIQYQTGLSNLEIDLYMKFLDQKFPEERSDFFRKVELGEVTELNLPDYTNALIEKYVNTYSFYVTVKDEFEEQQNQNVYKPLSYNGPCENIDFENGTTSGWQGAIATACENVRPCTIVNGFSTTRHQIMTTAMVDPYIPTLPVVAPGGIYSLRLENYVNGGNAAMARQTFLVTATNNIFTYQYAAVLEDPGDHRDLERPYFKVRMYDKNGAEINCATYTALAKPPIQNFTYTRVPNPNFNPTSQPGGANNQFLDLYYRNWTTITIPLLGYIGQNVTVEFTASDCSRGGHLGYAYIDASCSYLDTQIPPTICGTEDVTLYGPINFAKYQWSGPGIVGSATTQNIQANKSGVYKLTLTPVADNPCPITVQTSIPERCLPVPISARACETVKGSNTKNGVDLNSYNTPITAYNSLARVLEWHSAIPATAANKITNPVNVNITNGSRYYAIIKYTTAGSDTAELQFTINSLPALVFADINPLCKSSVNTNISGVSPAGGVFSGAHITSAGVFSPNTTGTFSITYKYTSAAGCIDSIKKTVTVNPPPTIDLAATQLLCATATSVHLTATATNQTKIEWSGGAGTFLNNQNSTTDYTPTLAEKNSGSTTLKLTITGISPCPVISDNIVISFTQPPTVNAGIDKDICVPINSVIQLQGNSTNAQQNSWSGGAGQISNVNSLNSIYTPSLADLASGSIILTLTTLGNTPCTQVQDQMQIRFHNSPNAIAGPDRTVCTGKTVSFTTTPITGTIYGWESLYGTYISSTGSASILADKDSTFVLKLTNQYGCTDLDTVKIDAFTPPTFNLGGPFCFSNSLLLNSNPILSDPLNATPTWYKNGNLLASENNFSLLVSQEDVYTIAYTQGECEVSSAVTVYKNPVLVTPDQFTDCEQNTIQLVTSNIPLATYYWRKNGTLVSGNTNSTTAQINNTIDKYTIEVIDQHNCKAKDSVEIFGIPRPVLQLTDASICEGSSLHIDGTPVNISGLSNYTITYKWYFNNSDIGKNVNSLDVTNGGNYALVASVNNCTDSTAMNVSVNPLPILDLPDVKKFCPESDHTVQLNAGSHTSYVWAPSGETSQKISVTSGGFYSVTVYNSFDCFTKGKIEVKEICPPRLFVADAFSPNEDGTNDLFNVYGAHIGTYKLFIFNRWGEIIFESTNKDHFWDGIYKGEIMPIGVYPWIITYEGDSQEYLGPYKLEGSVTLVK
ncbi:gliding motility-associated C-terminal domain-containing protein [Cytophaga aurantiaca]|uniref:gliding motility-associated C-terminal domain-containing protein n=1 Tax=Cytophaga aurantiaca TaxID=29530 RepID=UPI00036446BD|nr:gliding motility-associated C-terminal domain-containing protein [Cytophaga aurantiaca]